MSDCFTFNNSVLNLQRCVLTCGGQLGFPAQGGLYLKLASAIKCKGNAAKVHLLKVGGLGLSCCHRRLLS